MNKILKYSIFLTLIIIILVSGYIGYKWYDRYLWEKEDLAQRVASSNQQQETYY